MQKFSILMQWFDIQCTLYSNMTSSVQSENLIFQCSFPVTPADQDLPQSLAPSLGAKNGTSSSMLKRYYRYKKVWQMDYQNSRWADGKNKVRFHWTHFQKLYHVLKHDMLWVVNILPTKEYKNQEIKMKQLCVYLKIRSFSSVGLECWFIS